MNSTAANGTAANGTAANGTAANGTAANGTGANGTADRGTGLDGTGANGTGVGGADENGTEAAGTGVTAPLPAGTRLLHIGLPKTGTTTLQRGAAVNRATLAEHGVCYPGRQFNHRDAVAALMQRPLGWRDRGAALHGRKVWDRLLAEVEATDAARVFISHEFACESDDRQARRFADALGADRLHVAVTLRGFADLLPSTWQQFVKSGYTSSFEWWLRQVLGDRGKLRTTPTFYPRNDQAAIVRRWVRLLGPDRVSVVVADKRRPAFLIGAFEDMLGLPHGSMASRPVGGYAANRGLSAAEVELVRRLNVLMHEQHYDWGRYTTLVRHGVIARMQECRRPGPDEPSLRLPGWAARAALLRSHEYAEAIAASGCRVVGDLALLTEPVRTTDAVAVPTELPQDLVFEAVAGVLSAADGRGPFFDTASGGVERRRVSDPRLRRYYDPEQTHRILNAHRATTHLGSATIAAVMALREYQVAERRLTPLLRRLRRAARRMVPTIRRLSGRA